MKSQLVAIGVFSASVLVPVDAIAASFSGLYVFGDSLLDAGNTYQTTLIPQIGIGFPPPPYAQRFSNGPVWVEYLGEALGLNPTLVADVSTGTPYPEGINFAVGGATTGEENTLALTPSPVAIFPTLQTLPGLQQQIDRFTSLIPPGQQADPNALYIVWAGANDYLPTEGTFVPETSPQQPRSNLLDAVTELSNAGAKTILVANLPALGFTPVALNVNQSFPGYSASLNALIDQHNADLKGFLNQGLSSDTNLLLFDVDPLFDQALSGGFGFTNVTDACLNPVTLVPCSNPESFLFWDLYHPTTATHKILGEAAFALLKDEPTTSVPEPVSGLSVLVAVGIGAASLRRVKPV